MYTLQQKFNENREKQKKSRKQDKQETFCKMYSSVDTNVYDNIQQPIGNR